MITAVVGGQEAIGEFWVARQLVEIHDSIKSARIAYPIIDGAACNFARR